MAVDVLCSFPSCAQHNIYRRIHAVICCYSLDILMLSAVQPQKWQSEWEMRWDFHVQLYPLSWSTVKRQPLKLTLIRMIYPKIFPTVLVQPFVWSQPCYKMLSSHTDDEEFLWGAWEHTEDSVSCSVHPAINYINSSRVLSFVWSEIPPKHDSFFLAKLQSPLFT